MLTESLGEWRIFTRRDLDQTLHNWSLPEHVTLGLWSIDEEYLDRKQQVDRIHAEEKTFENLLRRLQRHVRAHKFEHGHEGKVPRAHLFRPYRLVLDNKLVAAVVFRASEAFNLCEIDVFLTVESCGLAVLETTRAALLFALADAAKNGGSMAVQFTRDCSPLGVPPHVRILAKRAGVQLKHADQGALSPDDARELFLRLSGLSEAAQERVRNFSQRGFFSIERICYLIIQGLWPVYEAEAVLLWSPFPDMILGAGIDVSSRHLAAHGMAHARVAVLGGILKRALRYVQPSTEEKEFTESRQFLQIEYRMEQNRLCMFHGPLPKEIQLQGWDGHGDRILRFPESAALAASLKPRPLDEIRVFLKHDIEQARILQTGGDLNRNLLIYPADFRQLSQQERMEANQLARQHGVEIVSCPESLAGLEAEVRRRQHIGRTIRQ